MSQPKLFFYSINIWLAIGHEDGTWYQGNLGTTTPFGFGTLKYPEFRWWMTSLSHKMVILGYTSIPSCNIHVENPLFADNRPNEKPWMVAKSCTSWLMIHLNKIPLVPNRFCNYWKLWNYNQSQSQVLFQPSWTMQPLFHSFHSRCPRSHNRFHRRWHLQAEPNALPCLLVDFPEMGRKVMSLPPKSWGFLGVVSSNLCTNRGNWDVQKTDFCVFVAVENAHRSIKPTKNAKKFKLLQSRNINYSTNRGMRQVPGVPMLRLKFLVTSLLPWRKTFAWATIACSLAVLTFVLFGQSDFLKYPVVTMRHRFMDSSWK